MPLDFLKRKNTSEPEASQPAAAAPGPTGSVVLPEEVVAQDFQLKLYYAGKTSEGVRMRTGPQAMAELPSMLVGLAKSEIEVVEPLPIEFSQATPTISRPSEATSVVTSLPTAALEMGKSVRRSHPLATASVANAIGVVHGSIRNSSGTSIPAVTPAPRWDSSA